MKTFEQIIQEEIASISEELYWYDGISWNSHLTEEEKDKAYSQIFNELLKRAKDKGIKEPCINHAGNGHYSIQGK